MAKTPGSPTETTATRAPARGQLQRVRGALGLDAVVAARAGAGRAAPARGRGRARSRRGRRRRPAPARASGVSHSGPAGPEADDGDLARAPVAVGAGARRPRLGHQHERHVGHRRRVDVGQRRDALLGRRWPARRRRARSATPAPLQRARARSANVRPSFITTAASVAAQPRRQLLGAAACPGRTVSTSSRSTSGVPAGGGGRAERRHAGDDLGRVAVGEPLVQVHVGAVEERVALAQHRDVAAGVEVRGELGRRPAS